MAHNIAVDFLDAGFGSLPLRVWCKRILYEVTGGGRGRLECKMLRGARLTRGRL